MIPAGERIQHQLASIAKRKGVATDLILTRHVMDGFLARLNASEYAGRYALKGGLLFAVWSGELLRTTGDVDLHGMENSSVDRALEVVRAVCGLSTAFDDGVAYDVRNARFSRLVGGRLPGDRVVVPASVGRANVLLKVDVGYGHPVVPGFERRWHVGVLPGAPSIELACYPPETMISEKLATAVEFGRDNTRLRDYWDVHALSTTRGFSGHELDRAIRATFASREAGGFIVQDGDYWRGALRPEFATAASRKQWLTWSRGHVSSCNLTFDEVLASVASFALPLLNAVRQEERPPGWWEPGRGWSAPSKTKLAVA